MNITTSPVEELKQFLNTNPCNFDYKLLLSQHSHGYDQNVNQANQVAVDDYIKRVVESKFQQCIDANSETLFLSEIYPDIESSYKIPSLKKTKFISEPLTNFFKVNLYDKLRHDILKDADIKYAHYINDFVENFSSRFLLKNKDVGNLNLHSIARCFFPSSDFHSRKARHKRKNVNDYYLDKTLTHLTDAFYRGEMAIKNKGESGKFDAGKIAEEAWFNVFKEYFGHLFDIYRDIPIKDHCNFQTPKIDILVVKKDRSHNTKEVDLDFVYLDDVVAAFEVKRKLYKAHVSAGNSDCQDIVENRCKLIKRKSMTENCHNVAGLTPYQILRGKVFFGVLSLDVEDGVEKILSSKESGFNTYIHHNSDECLAYLYPDAILCLNKLYWSKDVKALVDGNIVSVITSVNTGEALIDPTNTHIGAFFSKLRRFLIAQNHIPNVDESSFLGSYAYFNLFNCNYRGDSLVVIANSNFHSLDKIHHFDHYASTVIPNEYSNTFIHERSPVKNLRCWRLVEARDVIPSIKLKLKKIIKLEQKYNYKPLPDGISLVDESFDQYIDSLFLK